MTISEMHVWFRQYAQQMGMQNVRAILPEQIDLVINTAINDVVKQIIQESIGVTSDRIITDNSKLGQINALRSLYRVKLIEMSPKAPNNSETRLFNFSASDRLTGRMTTNFNKLSGPNDVVFPDYFYLVDFSLNYKKVKANSGYTGINENLGDYVTPEFEQNAVETNFFPVRIIDDVYLADTLNDFVLKNRLRSPIIVVYSSINSQGTTFPIFDLYIDKFQESVIVDGDTSKKKYSLVNNLLPYQLRMSYIAAPAKVAYYEDLVGRNVECDLPESLHIDILKHAVDLYHIATSGSLHNSQQEQQQSQQAPQQ